MATVSEIRAQYPQYSDLTDQDLIDRAGATPDTIGAVPNAIRSAGAALRGIGTGTYTLFQEIAARQGWDTARQWLDQELANREHENADRQIGMRESRISHFSEDPVGVVSGAIGQAAGSIPMALSPLGWGAMFTGQAGDNIQEQRDAQNIQPGESSLATALGAAAVQTGLERFGIEGWAARGFGRGTGSLVSRTGRGFAVGAISEGFTEGAQEAIQIAQGNLSDPTRVLGGDMLARIGEAAGLGAIGGGAIRGAMSATGPEHTDTPQVPANMTLDDALAIIERRGAPVQPTVQPRAMPGVTSRPVDVAGTMPAMDPALSAAMLSPDQREREIAGAALPEDQKINALNLYRQARDQQAATLQAGVERPPGQAGEARTASPPGAGVGARFDAPEGAYAPDARPVSGLLEAPPPPVVRDRAVSPLDDVVAGMVPEGTQRKTVDEATAPEQNAGGLAAKDVSSLETSPSATASVVTGPEQEGALSGKPSDEEVTQARSIIDTHLNRYRSRGKQGEEVARATQAVVDDDLTNGRITAPQAASAFSMAEAMSSILPANAGQEVRFARQMMGQREDGTQYEKQGSQTRYAEATPEGMQGLIQLSLAERQLPLAKQTSAHEAWHVMEDWFRAADPKVARELERAFPAQADGTARLQDVDASLLRLLKRNKIGDETYFDYLSKDETGHGPGVFKNPGEAMATVFGAVYDIHSSGQPTPMRPLLRKAFDFFLKLIGKVRSSPARAFMEGVADGRYRQSVGDMKADITQPAVSSVQAEPEQGEPNVATEAPATEAPEQAPSQAAAAEGPRDSARFQEAMNETEQNFVEDETPDAWRGPVRAARILAQTDQTTQERWRSAAERFNADHMDREFFNTADALVDLERMLPGGYSPLFAALKRSVPRTAITYTNQFRGNPEVMGTKYRMDRGIGSHFQPVGSTNLGYIYLDGKQFKADPNMNSAMVFVHEAVHHASFNAMRGLEKAAKGGSAMAQEKLRLYDRLRDITAERSMSEDLWGEHLNAGSFAYMTRGRHYRNSSIEEDAGDTSARQSGRDEFLAEAMASPYFQSYLSTIALPEDMQRDFQKLIGNRPRNILQAMVDWLKSALGLANNTVLDGVFILSPEMFNMGHVLPTEETVQSEPNAVRDSARDLPATTKKALGKLSPEGIHGWAMRARANKPLSAGMREQLKSWARTKLVDRYSAIEDMEARLTGQGRMTADMSGYTNLWQAEDADRFLSQMLRTGGSLKLVRPDPTNPNISWFEVDPSSKGGISWLTNMLTGTDPKTGKQRTKADGSPLVETRQEADALMDGFQLYSIVKRGDRLNKEGILTPITSADRQAAADAVKRFPEIIEGYAGYQKFNRNLMQLAVDSGLLEQKDADHFMKHNDYYPFYREIPKNDPLGARKIAGISAKFKLKEVLGGDKPFVDDPITVVLNNASFWMHASMLNNAKQKVVATGRKTGDIRAFDKTKDQPDIKINVRVNGKDYAFASEDPSLTTALESYWGMAPETQKLLNVFGWPARFLRELVTKNPAFMLVSNPIRDSVSAWQATGASMTPIIDTYRGMVEAYTHNQEAIDYMSLGHGGSRRYEDGPMRDAGDLIRDDILIEKGIYSADTSGKLMAVLRKAYLKLDAVSEASDMATRIPIYRSALAETGGNKAEAAWRAREALNFTKRGSSTALRAWSMLVPFTNARIQGMDVLVQSLSKDSRIGSPKEDRGKRLTRALARGAMLTTVAVLAEMMFGDDDERKEAPEWVRNQNVLIPLRSLGLADSGLLAIPKPFEYGAIFMTLPEHLYRYINGSQTMRGLIRDGVGSIPASMAYNPVPAAVLPIAEEMVNYSMLTGRPVVGRALQSQSPEWQFTTNTPAFYRETAMAFAQTGIPALMKSMGLELPRFMTSPVTMEHFVRGYTGSLGIQASIAAGAMIGGGDFREFTWDRMPMASTVVRTRNNMGPGGTNTLYDLAEASAELGQQIRRYTEAGNMQMVRELSQQNSALIQARPMITSAQQAMTRLSQQERALIRDPQIPEEVRRRRLQAIEAQKRETVRTMEALRVRVGR